MWINFLFCDKFLNSTLHFFPNSSHRVDMFETVNTAYRISIRYRIQHINIIHLDQLEKYGTIRTIKSKYMALYLTNNLTSGLRIRTTLTIYKYQYQYYNS